MFFASSRQCAMSVSICSTGTSKTLMKVTGPPVVGSISSLPDDTLLASANLGSLVIGWSFLAWGWSVASASRLRCSSSCGVHVHQVVFIILSLVGLLPVREFFGRREARE